MRIDLRFPFFFLLGLVLVDSCAAQDETPLAAAFSSGSENSFSLAPGAAKKIEQQYGKLPLSFEVNQGQADPRVRFSSRGRGYSLFLTDSAAVLALTQTEPANLLAEGRLKHGAVGRADEPLGMHSGAGKPYVVRMEFVGANPMVRAAGAEQLPGHANYFVGSKSAGWRSNIPTFASVVYGQIYNGIDLVFYGNQNHLEYDFVVAPGVSPRPIRLRFGWASRLSVTPAGDLSISARRGKVTFHRPVIYQETNGSRKVVSGRFKLLAGNSAGFSVGNFDHTLPLVIDPVLSYSTYVGGASGSGVAGMAVDAAGNAYVTGTTGSMNYPVTAGAFQATNNDLYGNPTVFVAKLNTTGTALLYSTYPGGTGQFFWGPFGNYTVNVSCGSGASGIGYYNSCGDYAGAIAVDESGDAYVAGSTFSTDFPVTAGAFQNTNLGAGVNPNVFLSKLNPTGTALVYSTYLGGSGGGDGGGDTPSAIALGVDGTAYVAGYAFSADFPVTPGAVQPSNGAAVSTNAFVTRLNATGTGLVYSTYLGGGGLQIPWYDPGETQIVADGANAVAVDAAGDAYVTGVTYGDFPVTPGAYQTSFPNPVCFEDQCEYPVSAFVSKLNPAGTGLDFSTYLIGTSATPPTSAGNAIAVDSAGSAYVAGSGGADFPVTPGAYQSAGGGAFITKMTPDGSALVYSTFFSGNPNTDSLQAIAVDGSGHAYIAGNSGPGLPITADAFQPALSGTRNAFLSELDSTGSTLLYSTYLGGGGGASAASVALNGARKVYVAGSAGIDFPVTPGALQTGISGSGDGFVAKLDLASAIVTPATTTTLVGPPGPAPAGMPETFTATVIADNTTSIPTGSVYFSVDGAFAARPTLNPAGQAVYTTASLPPGTHRVEALYDGGFSFSASNDSVSEEVIATAVPTISPDAGPYVGSVLVTLSCTTPNATIYFTVNGGAPTTASPDYQQPFTVSGYSVIRAFATLDGYAPTTIAEKTYSIVAQTPAPIIGPASGRVPVGQAITMTDADPTATIRYTVDGTLPTPKSNWYHGPIILTGPETITAIAISTGQLESEPASSTYTVTTSSSAVSTAISSRALPRR